MIIAPPRDSGSRRSPPAPARSRCPPGNPACGRRTVPAARRMRLHGLHGRSMRTTVSRVPRGAYRRGSEGPNTATIGVPTALARCIGPVSPVTNRSSCAITAATVSRLTSPERSSTRFGGSAARTRSTCARSAEPPVSTMAAERSRDELFGDLAESLLGPLFDRPPAADVDPDLQRSRRAARGAVPLPRGSPPERGASTPPAPSGARPTAACTSLRALSTVCGGGVVVERHVEERAAASAREPDRAPRAGRRDREVRPDVGLEVDREIVVARSPARRRGAQGRAGRVPSLPAPASRRPASRHDRCRGSPPAMSRFQLPTARSIDAPGASARSSASACPVISRSPMRSSRKQRIRRGGAGSRRRKTRRSAAGASSASAAATSARSRRS